ncbi:MULTISPECIES: hypothetical protein [Pectobacterium]|uniref:hypothetical protein n=1 Tax=Pectobacterium TaxID=122277 RepID=UPI0005057271|nr:hypothetical protein [Pectobacterium odoriferum]KGA31153.1 hypothetical protein KS43_19645 [Pectobacterium odoriferum]
MRITISVNSTLDIEAACKALSHFIKEKKPEDGTSDIWGIGINGTHYFCVGVKKNGNYTVKQSSW